MKHLLCILLLLVLYHTPARAQNFTLAQLTAFYDLVDLPSVEGHLEKAGWRFSESSPDEATDQVSWKHQQSTGKHPAVLNVFFCNLSTNLFCDNPEAHANHGQHVYSVLYQPSASTYQAIKQEAIRNKMVLATSVMENSIRYQYTGTHYVVWLQAAKYEDGIPRYFVELRPRDTIVAE